MPSVTDWISSIGSLVGGLTGIGALIVAVLSYMRSSSALAADARTRGAVNSTLEAVEALGQASGLGAGDKAPEQHLAGERYETTPGDGDQPAGEGAYDQAGRDAYERAVKRARRRLEK